jgi:nucleoside-diphosphate-sugar epimerase
MNGTQTVLVVGGTGRTGGRVVEQLLGRGVDVRAIVRSADRLPPAVVGNPRLTVVEADLLSMSDEELTGQVRGCDAIVSCLGHVINVAGIFGPPRDLVVQAARRLCRSIEASKPAEPVRFILMSTVSVNDPRGTDARRGGFEKACLWTLRGVVPPSRDNQQASDFLCGDVGPDDPYVQWVVVRPDTLLEGEVSEYAVHEHLVSGLFKPDNTDRANVAHFMCELVTDQGTWDDWKGKLPVVVNVGTPAN